MTVGGLYRRIAIPARRAVATRLPLSAYQRLFRGKVVGLAYHTVSDTPNPSIRHLYPYKTTAMFEDDLRFLKAECRVISYEQFLRDRTPEPGSILLTFDDGYRECASEIRALLLKHRLPCLFFVTSDFIDNRQLFYRNKVSLCLEALDPMAPDALAGALRTLASLPETVRDRESFTRWIQALSRADEDMIDRACEALHVDWRAYLATARPYLSAEEIRSLASDGFTIGAHSCTHARLGELTHDAVKREIVDSCRAVQEITGQDVIPFAFPYSADRVDRRMLADLKRECPFIGPLFDCRGIRRDDPVLVDRVWADPPPAPDAGGSNLGALLAHAYQERLLS